MARKPVLSPSRITTYLACPTKYMWTYIDPRGKWFARAKSYYSFGSSLHAVLQRFHDAGDVGVQTKEQAIAALEESWVDAGYSSPEEAQEALAEGRELISTYVEEQIAAPSEAKTIYIEKQLRKDMGDFVLMGRIDRVDEWPDGKIEIIDYKSGRKETDPTELLNDIAMNCYHLLLRGVLPDNKMVSTIIAVRTGSKTTVEPTEAALEEFRHDLLLLGGEILNREWEDVRPMAKEICASCDFLELCKRDGDFAETFAAEYSALNAD